MLNTYNLKDTVYFPTRITKNSATLIDNIFANKGRRYNVVPLINGLSDHDAQLITSVNSKVPNDVTKSIPIRNINTNNILEFQMLLSTEQWDNIFGNNNVNNMFNNFINIYLRCFNACFPKKYIKYNNNNNKWITKGIRISCSTKRELLLLCKYNGDPNLKIYYKQYCRILTRVISAAKRAHYNTYL
jgi:hypothetical protein